MYRTTKSLGGLLRRGGLAIVIALTVSACGGQGGSVVEGPRSAEGLIETEGAPLTPTGTLRMTMAHPLTSWDPLMNTHQISPHLFTEYDSLTVTDEKGEAQPWLATEWARPEMDTWEFKLREDVTFHDGSTFDADAVKANLERARTAPAGPWSYVFAPITEVTAVDPTTVRVTFSEARAGFPYEMSTPAGAMVSPKALADGVDLNSQPAGSGGWIWDESESIEGTKLVYTANPDYWNADAVLVEKVELNVVEDANARVNGVQAGQADIAGFLAPPLIDSAEQARMRVGIKYGLVDNLAILDRNGEMVPAFKEPKVREALALLLDREGYNKAVYGGHGDPGNGFGAPGTWWYNEELADTVTGDVERAKELLAEAGYPAGFEFEVPNIGQRKTANEAIANMLARGGVTMKLVTVTNTEWIQDTARGRFPAALRPTSAVDPWTMWDGNISNHSPYNPFGLTDTADLDEKMAEAASLDERADQKKLVDEVTSEIVARHLVIPTGFSPSAVGYNPNVAATQEPILSPGEPNPRPHYLWLKD